MQGQWIATTLARALLALAAALAGCGAEPEPGRRTPHRTDFAPAEFGIGRAHTPNAACNRRIDRLLDEIRLCFNTQPQGDCERLQREHSDAIARLKGTLRCAGLAE